MGSRRCCCGTVDAPCSEQCCDQCMWGDVISETSGIPIGNLDSVTLYQGCPVDQDSLEIGNPKVKISYPKQGTYWVWFPPPFSANYDIELPSCTLLNPQDGGYPCWRPISNDDPMVRCLTRLPTNRDTTSECPSNDFQCNYYCGNFYRPSFSTISENEPYNQPIANPQYNWLQSFSVADRNASSVVYGYPCSTESEDNCCRDNETAPTRPQGFYTFNSNGVPPGECNRYGLTSYRRRLLENYYPWAWEIFAYNNDGLINFGIPVTFFRAVLGTNPPSSEEHPVKSAFQPQAGVYLTSLRHQFLGYAHCQHHFDRELGCVELQGEPSGFPLGKYIPRQFIYSCSGIPMFEFDFAEAGREGIEFDRTNDELIEKMRSFTVFMQSSTQTEEPAENFSVAGWPGEVAIADVRRSMNKMSSSKYSGFATKDWRKEALLELFEAENIYKEYSGNPNFDLFTIMGISRPADISTEQGISDAIESIFPNPLGAVRKRCRSVQISEDISINVLTPKNLLLGSWTVVDDGQELQSLNNADISAPLRNLSQYGLPTTQSNPIAYSELYAKISSLCYTYFRMMPGGWDWCTFGPMPNGNEPQNNWWFRKMAVAAGVADEIQFFQTVPKHSQLHLCSLEGTSSYPFEYAWNPTGRNILQGDDPVFEPDDQGGLEIGAICDPVCGRSTYTSYPDILIGVHSGPYSQRTCSPVNCPNSCIPNGGQHVSFVRYDKKMFSWDTAKYPYKSKLMNDGEKSAYLNGNLKGNVSVTNAPCIDCYFCRDPDICPDCFNFSEGPPYPPLCSGPESNPNYPKRPLNAACLAAETGEISPCAQPPQGLRNELRLTTPPISSSPSSIPPEDAPNSSGPQLTFGPVTIDDCGTAGTIFGCPAAGPSIIERLQTEDLEFPPPCRYYDPTIPVENLTVDDTMFTTECCDLISNCNDCNSLMEDNCWETASRWCKSPKYSDNILAFISDAQISTCSLADANDLPYVNSYFYNNVKQGFSESDISTTEYLCNSDYYSLNSNSYTPANQYNCATLLTNVSETYLQSIGMPSNMVNRYKGSFCFCQEATIATTNNSASGTPTNDTFLWSLTNPNTPDDAVCSLLALRLCGGADIVKYNCAYRKLSGSYPCNIVMNDSSGNLCSGDDKFFHRGICYKLGNEVNEAQCANNGGTWSEGQTGFPCWTSDTLNKIINGCYKAL